MDVLKEPSQNNEKMFALILDGVLSLPPRVLFSNFFGQIKSVRFLDFYLYVELAEVKPISDIS